MAKRGHYDLDDVGQYGSAVMTRNYNISTRKHNIENDHVLLIIVLVITMYLFFSLKLDAFQDGCFCL